MKNYTTFHEALLIKTASITVFSEIGEILLFVIDVWFIYLLYRMSALNVSLLPVSIESICFVHLNNLCPRSHVQFITNL